MDRIEFLRQARTDLEQAFSNGKPVLVFPPTCKLDDATMLVMWHKLRQIAEQNHPLLKNPVYPAPFPSQHLAIAQPCADCGCRQDTSYTTCPYTEEIDNREIWLWLCEGCREERARDI